MWDAIVIGAGPAGSTVAALLARAGWNVGLAEKAQFPRSKVCGSYISPRTEAVIGRLGLQRRYQEHAGSRVETVELLNRSDKVSAPMPCSEIAGRTFDRTALELSLREAAIDSGVHFWQPARLTELKRVDGLHLATLRTPEGPLQEQTRLVILAHGSWEPGWCAFDDRPSTKAASDLLAFKFIFRGATLGRGAMPMLAFPGGYGGMAHLSNGRVGLSACIRRDELAAQRQKYAPSNASEAVLRHMKHTIGHLARMLQSATLVEPPAAAGPIRPGIRRIYRDGVFAVGNAAGECHPVIAEGLSMAMQGAELLADLLVEKATADGLKDWDRTGREYERRWRARFAGKVHLSAAIARLCMSPAGSGAMNSAVRRFPALLTCGAALAGKS